MSYEWYVAMQGIVVGLLIVVTIVFIVTTYEARKFTKVYFQEAGRAERAAQRAEVAAAALEGRLLLDEDDRSSPAFPLNSAPSPAPWKPSRYNDGVRRPL